MDTRRTVVYVGLNPGAPSEVKELEKGIERGTELDAIVNTSTSGALTVAGKSYDLDSDQGVAAYIASLQLGADRRRRAETLLKSVPVGVRDEMAGLIAAFAKAQAGAICMDRLIISGHGLWDRNDDVSEFTGDGNGSIAWSRIKTLAELFPGAALQVKHLALSACATGSEAVLNYFRGCFKALVTFEGYVRAPSGAAAGRDLAKFTEATAPTPGLQRPRGLVAQLAHRTSVAWTAENPRLLGGSVTYTEMSNAEIEARVARLWPKFERFVSEGLPGAHNNDDMIALQYMLFTRLGRADLDAPAQKDLRDKLYAEYLDVRRLRLGM